MYLTKLKILADMKKPYTLFVKLYGNCYKIENTYMLCPGFLAFYLVALVMVKIKIT